MADILASLGELEGHEFSHAGQIYTIVTVTANRAALDDATKADQGPIHIHFTVTSPARQEPIGLTLLLASRSSNDLAFVREHVESRVRSIVDGAASTGQIEHV
jgi:hypothetical protein